ncbi:BTB/POZ domain-containing protein 2 [Folsomia candida]|uniref:BTB/POZ domain-containing protein 2 n=1 Tax=Folsomia candida TaxID=158441 RepID=A0A226EH70_FOLCA|nr:BTB/POZ domain-containing protein 2 [Folsomia candida]OXA56985.1 BTB/POZ domain-containing protein 2 [Folsomia candida]
MSRMSSRDASAGLQGTTEVEVQPPAVDWRTDSSTIKEKLYNSLLTGCFSDIRFIVGQTQKKEIAAHRYILFLNSPVFETLLDGSHKAVNVTIADVEPEAFFSFLKFLYTDEFDVHVRDATAVLYLSKKYDVPRLAALSAEHIKKNISTNNVVSVLLSAESLGENSISFQARYFLRTNIRYVIHEQDFLRLNEEELCQIFASDELSVSEMELFNAAVHWAIEECKRQKLESTPQNYRFVLKNVIQLIRFPLMDRKEFTLHVATKNVLTDSECLNVMMHWDVTPKERATLPPLMFINKPRTETNISSDAVSSYLPQETLMMMSPREMMDQSYYYDTGPMAVRGYRSTQSKPPPPPRRTHAITPTKRHHNNVLHAHAQQPGSLQPFSYLPDPYTGTVSYPQSYGEF